MSQGTIRIRGARTHNLRNVDLDIPQWRLVVMTGLSGSGKSSLINDTLVPAVAKQLGLAARPCGPYDSLRGAKQIDKLIEIDQQQHPRMVAGRG